MCLLLCYFIVEQLIFIEMSVFYGNLIEVCKNHSTIYLINYYIFLYQRDSLVLHGLAISAFLAEAGWLPDAEVILTSCQNLLADSSDPLQKTRALECCHR